MPHAPIRAVAILTAIVAFGAPAAEMPEPAQTPDLRTRFVHRGSDASPAGGARMGGDSAADGSPGSAAPALTPRQPTATWDFGRVDGIDRLTFSPDGRKLYARVHLKSVNVWAMLVWYWPEFVALPILIIVGVKLWRTLRNTGTPGEEYCVVCGYALRGLTSERCPECGGALADAGRVIAGRRGRRALTLAMLFLAPVAGLYWGGDALLRARRAPAGLFDWRSHDLWERAEPKTVAPEKTSAFAEWIESRTWLVELDRAGGGRMRVIRDDPPAAGPDQARFCNMLCAPDGRSLYLFLGLDTIGRVDVGTGELVWSRPIPPTTPLLTLWRDLCLTRDGSVLRVAEVAPGCGDSGRWNWLDHFAVETSDGRLVNAADPRLAAEPLTPTTIYPPRWFSGPSALGPPGSGWAWRWRLGFGPYPWVFVGLRDSADGCFVGLTDCSLGQFVAILSLERSNAAGQYLSHDRRSVVVRSADNTLRLFDLSDLSAPEGPTPPDAQRGRSR